MYCGSFGFVKMISASRQVSVAVLVSMLHGGSAAPSMMLLFGLRAARVAVEVADGKPQLQGTGSTQKNEDKCEIN
jgi:hypothetical protein